MPYRRFAPLVILSIVILLVVLGCSNGSGPEETGTPAAPPPAVPGIILRLRPVATGLSGPVYITHAGDERLFVVEQPGRIRIIQQDGLVALPFLDIVPLVQSGGEQGLL